MNIEQAYNRIRENYSFIDLVKDHKYQFLSKDGNGDIFECANCKAVLYIGNNEYRRNNVIFKLSIKSGGKFIFLSDDVNNLTCNEVIIKQIIE